MRKTIYLAILLLSLAAICNAQPKTDSIKQVKIPLQGLQWAVSQLDTASMFVQRGEMPALTRNQSTDRISFVIQYLTRMFNEQNPVIVPKKEPVTKSEKK